MNHPPCHLVIPAAGVGHRMGLEHAKQFLKIAGKMVLQHTLDAFAPFAESGQIQAVWIGLSAPDDQGLRSALQFPLPLAFYQGGASRQETVWHALEAINVSEETAWVMVHDAARPCVSSNDIANMLQTIESGTALVLGAPVNDTLKHCDQQDMVVNGAAREGLWRAFTPQMAGMNDLRAAYQAVMSAGDAVTDEAAALSRIGATIKMIQGSSANIKLTHSADLDLITAILRQQGRL